MGKNKHFPQAFNDALLMLNAPHVLLQKYFKSDPCYLHLLDDFMFAARSAATGRLLQFEAHPVQAHGLETYTYKTYRVGNLKSEKSVPPR